MSATTLTLQQAHKCIELLQSNGGVDFETLKAKIVAEAKIPPLLAEAYIKSYRHVPHTGTIRKVIEMVGERPIDEAPAKPTEPRINMEGMGKIEMIIHLTEQGKSKKEIIALGFSQSTVHRQVGEYFKRKMQTK